MDHRKLKEIFLKVYTYWFCATAAGRSVCPVYGEFVRDRWSRLENTFQLNLFSNITPNMGIYINLQRKDNVDT